MFPRARKKLIACIALFALVFSALWPTAYGAANTATTDVLIAATLCSVDGVQHAPPATPDGAPSVPHHKHCAFCASGVSVFVPAGTLVLIADAPAPVAVLPSHPELLPPDGVALQPLSPRAPPRRA